MGDDLRLLTAHNRDVPLATLQQAVSFGSGWPIDHEKVRAIYAIRIYPEAIQNHPDTRDAVDAVRIRLHKSGLSWSLNSAEALRKVVFEELVGKL